MNGLFIRSVLFDWDSVSPHSYTRRINAINRLERLDFSKRVTFLVGENGSGKSTLLEAIAIAYGFNPEGGTRNYNFSTYDSHSDLCDAVRLVRGVRKPSWGYFLRAESFYNVATASEIEYGKEFLHYKSHGESFLDIARGHFKENGIYLLDEPEAALSPQRQLTLLSRIAECAENSAQFIIATHSPILLGLPDAEIFSFDGGCIHPIAYEETDSYKVMKMFINNREQVLKYLLDQP